MTLRDERLDPGGLLLPVVLAAAWLTACGDPTVVIGRDGQDMLTPSLPGPCQEEPQGCGDAGAPGDDDCPAAADCEAPPDTPCSEDTCVPCQSDTDCEDDQICDPGSGVCVRVDLD